MTTSAAGVLVSVVMIFRNAERFFQEAIDSVLAQTHPALELLLCDDGSSDGSTATALGAVDQHPGRVRYLEHPGHAHRGMSSTRNLGLAAARGNLVAFLDADDVWEPGHLQHEVGLLMSHPEAGQVCGRAIEWHSWADPAAQDVASPLPWPAGVVVEPPEMLVALLRRGAFRTPVCSLLVRKEVLESVGGSEDQFEGLFEDQALLAKLYLSQRSVISGARSARYRRHAQSSTARATREGTYDPNLPNPAMEAFLSWLGGRIQRYDGDGRAELLAVLAAARASYERPPESRSPISVLRRVLPAPGLELARRVARRARSVGPVRMGSLRRTSPLSRQFGYDRGLPVDRYYLEQFLAENAQVIGGAVLEVGDSEYTRRFGGSRVRQTDVLNIRPGGPETTIVADLADGTGIPSDSFDCLVITQTLHLVYELAAAVHTLRRILRPGGTVLATFPGISPISSDVWAGSWNWALTPLSARRLFEEVFGEDNVEVRAYGNVLSSVAFLEGMAAQELRPAELDHLDSQYPMLVAVRAQRPLTDEAGRA